MARGQRKSIDEKILEKEEIIGALKVRMQSEERELADMKKEKQSRELEAITDMLKDANISVEEAKQIIGQYLSCGEKTA